MLKVCSFLPAVTQMIYDMGLAHYLQGVTFECPAKALSEKQVIVRCILEGKQHSSIEIDRLFSASKRDGKSLYYVDKEALESAAPDVIFTQDVCDVCQIDTECTAEAIVDLSKQPKLISITPASLEDVFLNAITIANALGEAAVGVAYVDQLKARIRQIALTLKAAKVQVKEVLLLEWIDPLFNCGHWIPDQITSAGGFDRLSKPAGDSSVLRWEDVVAFDPEVLVIAPCGFSIDRTLEEMHILTTKPEWPSLRAVQNKRVYIADFSLFTQSSAGTLVDGIELLAGLFHPNHIKIPKRLSEKVVQFTAPVTIIN